MSFLHAIEPDGSAPSSDAARPPRPEAAGTPRHVRPYFIPADLDFESLPEPVRLAVDTLVGPAYEELVLQAPDALERAAGASFVCLLFLELLDQFDLGRQVAERMAESGANPAPRDADLNRYLRLMSAKERAGNFLVRIRNLRAKIDPHAYPPPGGL